MGEVSTFLREAWTAAERTRIANEAAAESSRIAKEVEDLQRRIASENDEIAQGWKLPGIAIAIEAGILFAGLLCAGAANNFIGKPGLGGILLGLLGALGALGAIVFGLAWWVGLVVVAGILLRQLGNVATRYWSIAALKADIRSRRRGQR